MTQWHLNHGIRAIVSIHRVDPKQLLVEAAERQFATFGFAATTVRSIADHAGVPHHTVYRLFGTKAGLLKEVEARSRGTRSANFATRIA